MRRLSEADFAVYVRNISLALKKEAAERGIKIDIHTDGEVACTRFGEYEYFELEGREKIEYMPLGDIEEWCSVTPEQIRLNKKPLSREEVTKES